MLRSSETQIDVDGTSRSRSAAAVKRSITSGPTSIAVTLSGSKVMRGSSVVTTPTRPCQSAGAASTVTCTETSKRARQRSSSET